MKYTVIKSTSYIDKNIVKKSVNFNSRNNFIGYLLTIFDNDTVRTLCRIFYIGTSKHWQGANVFWQIDDAGKVRSGKIIHYNPETGKRGKQITWVHSVLKYEDFNLKQCLYGLHRIRNCKNKIIGIVESEKTAIIMTGLALSKGIMKNYTWLATGSLNMFKSEMLKTLKKYKIVLYPDLGIKSKNSITPFLQWENKTDNLKKQGFNIIISRLLEQKADLLQKQKGEDIADFVIRELN